MRMSRSTCIGDWPRASEKRGMKADRLRYAHSARLATVCGAAGRATMSAKALPICGSPSRAKRSIHSALDLSERRVDIHGLPQSRLLPDLLEYPPAHRAAFMKRALNMNPRCRRRIEALMGST